MEVRDRFVKRLLGINQTYSQMSALCFHMVCTVVNLMQLPWYSRIVESRFYLFPLPFLCITHLVSGTRYKANIVATDASNYFFSLLPCLSPLALVAPCSNNQTEMMCVHPTVRQSYLAPRHWLPQSGPGFWWLHQCPVLLSQQPHGGWPSGEIISIYLQQWGRGNYGRQCSWAPGLYSVFGVVVFLAW